MQKILHIIQREWLEWWLVATVQRNALVVAGIVGTIIVFIHHGDALIANTMTAERWWKVLLTYPVPYLVSSISAVLANKDLQRKVQGAIKEGFSTLAH